MNKLHHLPPALLGDKSSLSNQARAEIQELCGAQPKAFLLQVIGAWSVILTTIALAIHIDTIWMSIVAIVVIATRQNILALLVHEQAHLLSFQGQYGDLIANLLAAYPLGITTQGYANAHLSHHKYYFTDKDPDFLRKSGADWTFPMKPSHLAKLLARDLIGLSFIKLLKEKQLNEIGIFKRTYSTPRWPQPAFYLIVTGVAVYTETWNIFLIYWILPLITVFPIIIRLGAITEHIYNLPGANVNQSSPLIILSWWEKLLLPNLNFSLHPYHHLFPGVAYCNLPKIHEIFQREKLVNKKNIFFGYWNYLKYLQFYQNISIVKDEKNKNPHTY